MTAILFDLDGTLIDSIELILRSFEHTWEAHGRTPVSRAEWLQGVGRPLRAQFGCYEEDPARIEALIDTYRDYNRAHHDDLVRPFPGVVDEVRDLSRRGARLGIVTSKSLQPCLRGLETCGFASDLFDAMVTADEDIQPKPHPAPVLAALSRLGASAQDATFVGDSPHDMVAGRRAGVTTAVVMWGPFDAEEPELARADRKLETARDLRGLMPG